MIIPTAEPFLSVGGPIGILLVHGFTGAPKEMRWMGDYFTSKGYTVLGVRLAGHATDPEDMLRVQWEDWLSSVEDGYHLLKDISEDIIVAGLSMGGCLSLLFASNFRIRGVIAMSTPYELPPDPRIRYLPILSRFMPRTPKGDPDWQDSSCEEDHICYEYYPTKAVIELNKLLTEMQSALSKIKMPALLIHSRKDQGVAYENMEKIYSNLGSSRKEMVTLEDSGHVIVRDREKELVFETAENFIISICGNNQ